MKKSGLLTKGTLLLTAMAGGTLLMFSCKGRTDKDMVPNGDTVEVVINPPADAQTDTTLRIDSTIQNEN